MSTKTRARVGMPRKSTQPIPAAPYMVSQSIGRDRISAKHTIVWPAPQSCTTSGVNPARLINPTLRVRYYARQRPASAPTSRARRPGLAVRAQALQGGLDRVVLAQGRVEAEGIALALGCAVDQRQHVHEAAGLRHRRQPLQELLAPGAVVEGLESRR